MGFIYSAATSVIIVLKSPAWRIIQRASSTESPEPLSSTDMSVLEADKWISRVWTYQELVNSRACYFTSPLSSPDTSSHVAVDAVQFFNYVGFSLSRWKTHTKKAESASLAAFPNLNTLEDTLADRQLSG